MSNNRLSFTMATMFLDCQKKYEYHYIQKIRPIQTTSALMFGVAIDKALNDLLEGKDPKKVFRIFVEEMKFMTINGVKEFAPRTPNIKFTKKDLDEDLISDSILKTQQFRTIFSLIKKGKLLLEAYQEFILPHIKKVLALQEDVNLENEEGDIIRGKLDAIIQWENGKTYLIDHKTTSVEYTEDSAKTSPQLALYHFIKKDDIPLDGIGFIVLNKNIGKKIIKECQACGKIYEGKNNKTCMKKTENGRCDGKLNISYKFIPEVKTIFSRIEEETENKTIEMFDNVNNEICNGHLTGYKMNRNSCFGKYGKCPYLDLCNNNSMKGLKRV